MLHLQRVHLVLCKAALEVHGFPEFRVRFDAFSDRIIAIRKRAFACFAEIEGIWDTVKRVDGIQEYVAKALIFCDEGFSFQVIPLGAGDKLVKDVTGARFDECYATLFKSPFEGWICFDVALNKGPIVRERAVAVFAEIGGIWDAFVGLDRQEYLGIYA
ncbi:MAG: hypothetical protein PHV13_02490 [Candidatus ainarchaeum sp.]|nr:hypothetical protein [Candidatus ainarchaeum sp.]